MTLKELEAEAKKLRDETIKRIGYVEGMTDLADRLKQDLTGWETEPTDEEIERVIDNVVNEMIGDPE